MSFPTPTRSVYVGNIPFSSTEESLLSAFAEYEPVSVKIVEGKGIAFIEVPARRVFAMVRDTDGSKLDGRLLSVSVARPRANEYTIRQEDDRPPHEERPQRPEGDREFRGRGRYGDDRPQGGPPYQDRDGSRPPQGDRPYGNRPYGDRNGGDRPNRPYGDRPGGNRPYPPRQDDRSGPPPGRPWENRDRPFRPDGDRPPRARPYDNRPGERPQGGGYKRDFSPRPPGPEGEDSRPQSQPRSFTPKKFGPPRSGPKRSGPPKPRRNKP